MCPNVVTARKLLFYFLAVANIPEADASSKKPNTPDVFLLPLPFHVDVFSVPRELLLEELFLVVGLREVRDHAVGLAAHAVAKVAHVVRLHLGVGLADELVHQADPVHGAAGLLQAKEEWGSKKDLMLLSKVTISIWQKRGEEVVD